MYENCNNMRDVSVCELMRMSAHEGIPISACQSAPPHVSELHM